MSNAQIPSIIPAPLTTTPATGALSVRDGSVISFAANDPDSRFAAQYLADILLRTRGLRLALKPNQPRALIFFRKSTNGTMATEGYDLTISPKQALVTAPQHAGLFYGSVSLWNLLTADGLDRSRSALTDKPITSWPCSARIRPTESTALRWPMRGTDVIRTFNIYSFRLRGRVWLFC